MGEGVLGIGAGVLGKLWVFWIRCGCSGVGEGILGVGAGVLEKVRVIWSGKGCSGVCAGVQVKVRVF